MTAAPTARETLGGMVRSLRFAHVRAPRARELDRDWAVPCWLGCFRHAMFNDGSLLDDWVSHAAGECAPIRRPSSAEHRSVPMSKRCRLAAGAA
jgi:hypothetical protein